MRFPKVTQLDGDQAAIFQGAPPEGPVLIMGPPGTGKTVIAFHRANYLYQLGKLPQVVMYNKVLKHYTSTRGTIAQNVPSKTLHKWVFDLWRKIGGQGYPPALDGDGWTHDWDQIRDRVIAVAHPKGGQKVNWGHLIVDEAQDFPQEMYQALYVIMNVVGLQSNVSPKLGVTILADENQRLEASRNSTIEQIRAALLLPPERVYGLKKNYRNSKQIAAFAASFYVGLPSGIPNAPSRHGPSKPIVSVSIEDDQKRFWSQCVTRIVRHARARVTEEIGVLVPSNKTRKSIYNRLTAQLGDSTVGVQTYASRDQLHLAEALRFDVPGHVTVLNFASAKGLEFDTVFVIDPGQLIGTGSSELSAKMTMYVMCSRARDKLEIMLPRTDQSTMILSWVNKDLYTMDNL
jgi:DNA helicase II / ATP-dependent DNA helicase PcrA